MQNTLKIRREVEKDQGSSHWKSPEKLEAPTWEEGGCAMTAGLGVSQLGSRTLERKPHASGQGGSAVAGSRPGLGFRVTEGSRKIGWVPKGAAEHGAAGTTRSWGCCLG
jgi:hypothetical protein